jgi:acetyltransferase-like isoleucine patch superfamily enzyme
MGSESELVMSGEDGVLVGPGSILRIDGEVTLGDCFVNSDSRIICEEDITVGDGVSISWNVNILDSNRHKIVKSGSISPKTAPVNIKNRVLIGHSASISKGVTIGEGSIVAAGSVVIDDVPSKKIVAGNPAKVIDSVQSWD